MKSIQTFLPAIMVAFSFSPAYAATVERDDPFDLVGTWEFNYPVVQFISRTRTGDITSASDVTITVEISTLCSNLRSDADWYNEWYVGMVLAVDGQPVTDGTIVVDAMQYGTLAMQMDFTRTESISDRERRVNYFLPHELWETTTGFSGKLTDSAERFNVYRYVDAISAGVTVRRTARTTSATRNEKEDLCDWTEGTIFYYPVYGKG